MQRIVLLFGFSFLSLTFVSCSIFWTGGDDGDVPARGLIAHYPFDGNAHDVAGPNNGEMIGAQPTENRFGEAGTALRFDGQNDYVRVVDDGLLNFDLREDSYSISLWAASEDAAGWARLVIKWNEQTPTPYPFSIQKVGDVTWGNIYDTQTRRQVMLEGVWDGGWHHIVVSYDAETNRMAGYLDGALVSTAAFESDRQTQNDSPVYIGRASPPREDRYFDGRLDDLRIYDRALTAAEVGGLFEAEG